MAKFTPKNRLFGKDKERLLFAFCHALHSIKSPEEGALFIQDLLSAPEAEMLAKRLKIAEMLIEGYTFDQIKAKLKTSKGTVARVSLWLQESGEGFRRVIKRLPEYPEEESEALERKWGKLKYIYPQYYWPQLLLEELVKHAPSRKKERLMKVLNKMSKKTILYRRLNKLLQEEFKINYTLPKNIRSKVL